MVVPSSPSAPPRLQTPSVPEGGYDSSFVDVLWFVLRLAADLLRSRAALVAENALLPQQLIVAQRKIVGRHARDLVCHVFHGAMPRNVKLVGRSVEVTWVRLGRQIVHCLNLEVLAPYAGRMPECNAPPECIGPPTDVVRGQ
jgi:hypothetical protein